MPKCFLILLFALGIKNSIAQNNFVRAQGHQFYIGSKPYYFIGTNYWYGSLLALQKNKQRGKQRLINELNFLQKNGINNLRVLVGAEGQGNISGIKRVTPALQPTQGKFDKAILESLDFLLYEMSKRNMVAVLYLSNNWEWSGGFLQYLNWNGLLPDSIMQKKLTWDEQKEYTSKFYSCKTCKNNYEKQLRYVLSHTNIYSHIKYTNDPAIMSWELANEPRPMQPYQISNYKKWIFKTANLIKSIDKNHLVTIGLEGSIGTNQSDELYKEVNTPKNIDYLTIHIWPKNWAWFSDTTITSSLPMIIKKSTDYIQSQQKIALQLNKPMVIEEFGLPRDNHLFTTTSTTSARDIYYGAIFSELLQSKNKSSAIAGASFWAYAGTAKPIPNQLFWKNGDDFMGDPPQEEQGLNAVFNSDKSTWNVVNKFAKKIIAQ
jgi:mannan endo-1,4-beta-mannosidase